MNVASKSILACAFLTMACSASSNSNNVGINGFTGQPQGNFLMTQQLDPNDTSIYTNGCATAGQSIPAYQVDPRLTPGMVFTTVYNIVEGTSNIGLNVQNTITSLTANTLTENMLLLGVTGDPNLQAGFSTTAAYILGSDGSFPVTYNPTISQPTLPACNVTLSSTGSVTKYLGTFITAGGTTVSAQETITSAVGDVNCNGQDLGNATVNATEVVSNDVPSEGSANFCGGVGLFTSMSETLTNGTVQVAISAERTVIPTGSKAINRFATARFHRRGRSL